MSHLCLLRDCGKKDVGQSKTKIRMDLLIIIKSFEFMKKLKCRTIFPIHSMIGRFLEKLKLKE